MCPVYEASINGSASRWSNTRKGTNIGTGQGPEGVRVHEKAIYRRQWQIFLCSHATCWLHSGVLPPAVDLTGFHDPFHDTTMVSLWRGEEVFGIDSGKNVVIADIAVIRAGQEMGHTQRRSKSVS